MGGGTLSELDELERLVDMAGDDVQARVVGRVTSDERAFPILAVSLGSTDRDAPSVGFFGGVHGLERIGSAVVIAYLRSVLMRLRWDASLHRMLETLRMVFVPLVNPGGMWRGTRANPNGVDLMRNAPLEAREPVAFLVGGQRISAALPWYRGLPGAPMEAESAALCRVVEEELLTRPFSIALDCHSGFGLCDRIWFPYAHSALPIAHLADVHALKVILDESYCNHRYVIEPQSRQYLAHGDLWDYLYLRGGGDPQRAFLPLTLEMGSWLWVKKNPRQLFSREGMFNPLIAHRQARVLRRHLFLLDFLARSACSYLRWLPDGSIRARHREQALARWYPRLLP